MQLERRGSIGRHPTDLVGQGSIGCLHYSGSTFFVVFIFFFSSSPSFDSSPISPFPPEVHPQKKKRYPAAATISITLRREYLHSKPSTWPQRLTKEAVTAARSRTTSQCRSRWRLREKGRSCAVIAAYAPRTVGAYLSWSRGRDRGEVVGRCKITERS